jgi:regulator of sigma E protease
VVVGVGQARQGVWELLHFLGVLNISLLVVNLLPIPAVDGGMIVLACLEGIRRRRFSMAVYARLQQIAIVLLLSLVAFTFYNDLARIFGGPGR